jgi:hypothetical protein
MLLQKLTQLRQSTFVRFISDHPRNVVIVALFIIAGGWMIGRFYHPVYGFTKFLQLSEAVAVDALPEVHRGPIYQHHNPAGYDGQFYSQLSLRPTLRDPQLHAAIDNFPLRARRPLVTWIAWLFGGGDTGLILQVYAWINVIGWFGFALLLLRVFPPVNAHAVIAWAGLLFSAGVLTSVSNALTDLPALILITLAMLALQRNRPLPVAAILAAATLTRETSVLAGSILLPNGPWRDRFIRGVILVLPFVLWLAYVRFRAGPESQSLGNFDWPMVGLSQKVGEVFAQVASDPHEILHWAALATIIGLIVQAIWIAVRPDIKNPWWQLGFSYLVLLTFLGWPTFGGYPAAVSRIILPLHLAFNALVPATRLGTFILLLGNLSVVSGLTLFQFAERDQAEIKAVASADGDYLAWITDEWYGVESNGVRSWSWAPADASLNFKYFPPRDQLDRNPVVRLLIVGAHGQDVVVAQGDRVLWSGHATQEGIPLELRDLTIDEFGQFKLSFHCNGEPWLEDGTLTGRKLLFAVYDLELGDD